MIVAATTGLIIIIFVCVSLWICNKYASLSRGLTRAGSRISNLSIGSDVMSNASYADRFRERNKGKVRPIHTGQLESTLASRMPQGISYVSTNTQQYSSPSRSSSKKGSYLNSDATSVRVSTNRPVSSSRSSNRSSSFRSDKSNWSSNRSSSSRSSRSKRP